MILVTSIFRRSPPAVFLRKGVLKICSKFTGEHPCRSGISIKLLKSHFSMGAFPANLIHNFRISFYKKNYGGRLLDIGFSLFSILTTSIEKKRNFEYKIYRTKQARIHKHNISKFRKTFAISKYSIKKTWISISFLKTIFCYIIFYPVFTK